MSYFLDATGLSGLKSITLRESMSQPAVQADIVCTGVSVGIGGTSTIDMGTDADHGVVMTSGIVKKITARRPQQDYEVTVVDKLSQAVDYFIAPDNPDSPFQASNRKAELLVGDLLGLAGLSLSAYDTTLFTFGTKTPVSIRLVSAWNYIEHINRITGFTTFTLPNGNIEFRDRKPYVVGGDASEHTFTTGSSGDILDIHYWKSDEKIRNRVVVYGSPGIQATSSGSSAYLPAGFFKTLVVSHEIIDNQNSADNTASVNLTMFNRLTETCTLKVIGNRNYRCRDVFDVSEAFTGLAAGQLWIAYGTVHILSRQGYTTELTLVR
jgi:hypothetical protein